MKLLDIITENSIENAEEQFCPNCGGSLAEEGRASRALCTSGRPDSALGASQLASCKSQGLRARDGEKSHLITHGARKVRITVGGKKIKGKRYGGPLPDYGTRKNQLSEAGSSKVYAIGDSHAEGLSYAKGIINYAHGGQPSTSNTNYSGNYNGHPTGIDNVPDGSFVVISQGCNDAANSSRAYQDSQGKTPLVPPDTIASRVARLVDAAQAKRCKVVFVLFPNGDAKIKPYYGGPYQEKVREAIRSAVGVPVVDLEGSALSDGVHAVPSAYKNAGSKVLSIFKIINEELSVPWSSNDQAINDIQRALISVGYNDVTVTGKLDRATRLALVSYQTHNRLGITGTANVETVDHLNKMLKALASMKPGNSPTSDTKSTTTAPVVSPKAPDTSPTSTTKTVTATKWGDDAGTSKPTTGTKTTDVKPADTKPAASANKDPYYRPIISNPMGSAEGRAKITKFFLDKKVKWNQIQGILININFESGYDSGSYIMHDSAAPKGSPEYLKAGPSGGFCHWHDAFEKGSGGVRRFTKMMEYCGGEGAWQMNWEKQLEFLLSEAPTAGYLSKDFNSGEEASEYFTKHWEFPANPEKEAKKRSSSWSKFFTRHE